MKRFLALGLALALLLSLSACQTPHTATQPDPERSAPVDATDPADGSAAGNAEGSVEHDPADQSAAASAEASESVSAMLIKEPELEQQRGPRTFGLSMPKHATLTQAAVAEALEKRLAALGDSLVTAKPASDAQEQIAQLNALAGQKVEAIFLCPTDGSALEETVTALSANLPIFGFGEWDFTPDGMISVVRSDDYNAGYVCGIDLAERFEDGGDVLVLDRPDSLTMTERTQGFLEAAEESGVELEVQEQLEVQEHAKDTEKLVKKALKEHPKAVGFFAASDRDAELLLKATAGTPCLVYSADGSPAMKEQLGKNPNLAGLGAQSPALMAQMLEESANEYLDGEAVEEEQSAGTFLITAKNVEKYGTDGWQ